MPTILIVNMSPGDLFRAALDDARKASAEIQRLRSEPLAPGETLHDRALAVATHAHALANAFDVIDAMAAAMTDESSPPCADSAPDHRGVPREDNPNTN